MAKDTWKGWSVGNERYRHDKAMTNPRDDERDPAPYDPTIDRRAIGTNAPKADR